MHPAQPRLRRRLRHDWPLASWQTEYDANLSRPILEACAAACTSGGDECEQHAEHGMEHRRVCAEQCRRCEQACGELLQAIA